MSATFTQRHYVKLAEVLKQELRFSRGIGSAVPASPEQAVTLLIQRIADEFEHDNPRFNRAVFLAACGLTEGKQQ